MSDEQQPTPWGAPPPGGTPPDQPSAQPSAQPSGWTPPGAPAPQPGGPAPQWQQPPPPGQPSPGQWSGAAHRPGAIPLRPLGLGDMYDAAFRIIRYNPMATVGVAVLVAAATTLPQVIASVFVALSNPALFPANPFAPVESDTRIDGEAIAGLLSTSAGSALLQTVGLILVTGLIAQVVMAACIGRTMSLGEAWAATLGSRWRMIGFAFLTLLMWVVVWGGWAVVIVLLAIQDAVGAAVLLAVVGFPVLVVVSMLIYVRVVYLAIAAICVERIGIVAAVRRSWQLTRQAFWRTFGIALLTAIVVGVAGAILSVPLGFVVPLVGAGADLSPESQALLSVIGSGLSGVITTAITAPFTAAVATLQYVDLRIRREGFDVELMAAASSR